jgi:tetratricopeptide (TPR) repeat protein
MLKGAGDQLGEAYVFYGLGGVEFQSREYDKAITSYTEARRLYQAVGNRLGEGNALCGLGDVQRRLGRNEPARVFYNDARRMYQGVGASVGEAGVLFRLGQLEATANPELARQHFHQAAFIYEQVGMPKWRDIALDHVKKLAR